MTTLQINRPGFATAFAPSRKAAPTTTVQTPTFAGLLEGFFSWLKSRKITVGRAEKRIKAEETLSLGEKRFVAVIKVDGREFLIGGAENNISVLSELAPAPKFTETLTEASIVKPRLKSTVSKRASHKLLPQVAAKVAPATAKTEGSSPRRRKTLAAQIAEQA